MPPRVTNKKKAITYLPVVARNGTRNGRHGHLIVDAVHVLVVDVGDGRRSTVVDARKAAVDCPAAVGRGTRRVVLGWRLFGGAFCSSERCRDAECLLRRADGLVVFEHVRCLARRGGRDVHGRARGRVLRRLAVRMVLVRRRVGGDGGCSRELGRHGCAGGGCRGCRGYRRRSVDVRTSGCGTRVLLYGVAPRNGTDKGRLWR